MARKEKLLDKARNHPEGLSIDDFHSHETGRMGVRSSNRKSPNLVFATILPAFRSGQELKSQELPSETISI